MFSSEFNQIVREHFDLSDGNTRRYIAALEDSGQEQLLNALSMSMYESIVSKVDEIDFGTIPMSRGDITKVQGFDGTEECLRTIRQLVIEYKQNPSVVDVVLTAIENMKERKGLFIKGYTMNAELPMLVYNLIVLAIERSTSLMIATCIQFIKDPSSTTPKRALDKVAYQKTMDDMLFQQLISFNNMCKKGTLDNALESAIKSVREDVEAEYDVVTPIEDPNAATVEVDVDPFGSEPFGSEESPIDSDDTKGSENVGEEDDPTIDTTNNIASDVSDTANGVADVMMGAQVPENDDVEPDKIPTVVPGDDISNNDSPINEDELKEGYADIAKSVIKVAGATTGAGALISVGSKATKIGSIAFGTYLAITKVAPFMINILIKGLRNLTYTFYYSKAKFSDYLEVQADLLESNANELEVSTTTDLDDNTKRRTIQKQRKIAEKLRKWANKFAIDNTQTQNKAKKAIADDEKEKKKITKDADGDDVLF